MSTYLEHLTTLEIQASAHQWLDWHWLHPSPRMVENTPSLATAQVQQMLQTVPASLFTKTYLKFLFARCGVELDESGILQVLTY